MNVTRAAKELGVSRQVIYRLAREGKLTIEKAHPLFGKHGPARISSAQVEALKPRPDA